MATATVTVPAKTSRRTITLCLLVLLAVPLSVWHIHELKFHEPVSHDTEFPWTHIDTLPVWMGTRMILHRENPYSDEAMRQIEVAYYGREVSPDEAKRGANLMGFAYPPQTAFVCAWFAMLPWKLASILMLLASIILAAAGIVIWLRVVRAKRDLLIVVCVMASWPALWGIRLENLSMAVIPAIFIAAALYLRRRFFSAALLITACMVKPQLCWLLIVWMLVDSIANHNWRFVAVLACASSVLAALSEIWLPGCFSAWFSSLREYRAYTHVGVPMLPLAVAACAVAIPALYQLRRDRVRSIALVLAMTITVCPTNPGVVYNYVLLIPSCVLVIQERGIFDLIAIGFIGLEYLLAAGVGLADIAVAGITPYFGAPGLDVFLPISLTMAISLRYLGDSKLRHL